MDDMSCAELVTEYLEDHLPVDERERIRLHLLACCAQQERRPVNGWWSVVAITAIQISYFSLGDKNRFRRRPERRIPSDWPVIIDSFWTGPTASQMRTDQIADLWRELRRKPWVRKTKG